MVLSLGIAICCAPICCALRVSAQEGFRIETDVFEEGQDKPFSRNLTLFKDGVGYDFPRSSPIVTLVDPRQNRIIVFDTARSLRTLVDIDRLREFTQIANQATKTGTTEERRALRAIIAEADSVRHGENDVTVGGATMKYKATLQRAPSADYAKTYAEFASALALFNAAQQNLLTKAQGANKLPFARLKLNEVVQSKNAIPREITRTIAIGNGPVIKCIVHATWQLDAEHLQKIESVNAMLESFAPVSQSDFFAKCVAERK